MRDTVVLPSWYMGILSFLFAVEDWTYHTSHTIIMDATVYLLAEYVER